MKFKANISLLTFFNKAQNCNILIFYSPILFAVIFIHVISSPHYVGKR